jgi:hypothetical protein
MLERILYYLVILAAIFLVGWFVLEAIDRLNAA